MYTRFNVCEDRNWHRFAKISTKLLYFCPTFVSTRTFTNILKRKHLTLKLMLSCLQISVSLYKEYGEFLTSEIFGYFHKNVISSMLN